MPVLSESHNGTLPNTLNHGTYIPLGLFLFLVVGLIICRQKSRTQSQSVRTADLTTSSNEKLPFYPGPGRDAGRGEKSHTAPESAPTNPRQELGFQVLPRREIIGENFQRPPQPPPFTPPMPIHNHISHQNSNSISTDFPMSSSPLFTTSPTQYTLSEEFTSMEDATSYPSSSSSTDSLPRRRSYTKALSTSSNLSQAVNGEVIMGEGWKRHTRVFGGGVCKACEESERKMSA